MQNRVANHKATRFAFAPSQFLSAADCFRALRARPAQTAGGNAEVTESSAVTIDVVSASFSVPTGGSDAVEVKVAPCTGVTSIEYPTGVTNQYLTFGAEKSPEEYGLPHISPDINETTNTVSTTGFDFADNKCGFDEQQNKYIGYKQIIRFTITVNDEAIGGPNVATNEPESGIWVDTNNDCIRNRKLILHTHKHSSGPRIREPLELL